MTETDNKFAAAALSVFARYGVRKTTMAEIAEEAGVSKPTLYAEFCNKDAALAGAIRLAKGTALNQMLTEWKSLKTLPAKLDVYFERIVIAGFDMLHGAPDADALDEGMGEASAAAVQETRKWAKEALKDAFFQFNENIERAGFTAETLAQFTVSTSMNAKRLSANRDELLTQLSVLRNLVIAAAQSA